MRSNAVVNARVVSLRAPMEGIVEGPFAFPAIGAQMHAGVPGSRVSRLICGGDIQSRRHLPGE
jgi:hypothetical protein